MPSQSYPQTLVTAQGDGSALSNSNTPTSIIPAQAKWTFPANFFQIGSTLRVTCYGRVSNIVTTPGTLTLDCRLGASTVIANGGAMQLNASAKTNVTFKSVFVLTCRAIGSGTAAVTRILAF